MPMFTMDNMRKLKRFNSLAHGKTWKMFVAFNSEAMAEGAISQKNKQLISLAVALTTQCPYSIEIHRENAKHAEQQMKSWPRWSSSPPPSVPAAPSPTAPT